MEEDDTDNFCKRHGNRIYDYFAIFLSLLDLTTDILVLIDFYQLGRKTFFWISLSILLSAQLSYVIAFTSRYGDSFFHSCMLFFCVLPFAPFASIAIYIIESYKLMPDTYNEYHPDNINKSPMQKWMERKVRSHLGFILEATIEAFPQSILQMIAIVVFEEYGYTNYIAICSILISMFSVSSKSFVFAAGTALDKFTLMFNWLCVILDFFGLFFMISWIFSDNTLIFNVFVWQFIVCIVPLAIWCMLGFWLLCINVTFTDYVDMDDSAGCFVTLCCCPCIFVGITVFILLCFAIFTMLLQIFHWTYLALLFYKFNTNRYHFENKTNANGYNHILNWINKADIVEYNNFSISKQQDRIIRIASTNWYMLTGWNLSKALPTLTQYLAENHGSQFQEVTYEGLRVNTDLPHQSEFLLTLKTSYFGIFEDKWDKFQHPDFPNHHRDSQRKKQEALWGAIFFWPIVYIFAPLYMISRAVGILYPVIIIMDKLFNHSLFQWDFQWFMLVIYICGEIVLIALLLAKVLRLQHIMWHILPSRSLVVPFSNDEQKANERIEALKFTYSKMIEMPMIKEYLIIQFSHDITDIILAYLWKQVTSYTTTDALLLTQERP